MTKFKRCVIINGETKARLAKEVEIEEVKGKDH